MHRHGQLNLSTRGLGGVANTDPAVEPRMAGMKSGRRALEFPWIYPLALHCPSLYQGHQIRAGKVESHSPFFPHSTVNIQFALCDSQGMHLMEVARRISGRPMEWPTLGRI